jgi:hypothetical protein
MISYGLGIKIISLITHPKILNFCKDINDNCYVDVNNCDNIGETLIKFIL